MKNYEYKPIIINTDKIISVFSNESCTQIVIRGSRSTFRYTVKESPDEILKLLERKA